MEWKRKLGTARETDNGLKCMAESCQWPMLRESETSCPQKQQIKGISNKKIVGRPTKKIRGRATDAPPPPKKKTKADSLGVAMPLPSVLQLFYNAWAQPVTDAVKLAYRQTVANSTIGGRSCFHKNSHTEKLRPKQAIAWCSCFCKTGVWAKCGEPSNWWKLSQKLPQGQSPASA